MDVELSYPVSIIVASYISLSVVTALTEIDAVLFQAAQLQTYDSVSMFSQCFLNMQLCPVLLDPSRHVSAMIHTVFPLRALNLYGNDPLEPTEQMFAVFVHLLLRADTITMHVPM